MSGKNFLQVAIKVRPLHGKQKDQPIPWRIVNNSIQLIDSQTEACFDHIFDQDASNEIIFDKVAKQIVHSALQGFNGTIFAYGQTSSGKTYTMMGDKDNPGVMVLAAKEIFKEIERTQDRQFLLRVGYIEIYNEKIYDLLNRKNQDLKIHDTNTGIVSVNCEEVIIRSEEDLLHNLEKGGKERTVGGTNMNERSSRSHAIFRIIIESRKMDRNEDDAVIQSVLNLVDLAGSERADQTGARGTRFKEGAHINKSLLFLSNVIKSLSENEDGKYINYRDSKLTRILQASLGGNALTAIICTIKPNAVEETQSTLNFALRAKTIKNKPEVNEIVSDATMMKRLEHEIKVLKTRLKEEEQKNESQFKVRQLEQRIRDEDLKIISWNSLQSRRDKRRRTWCPSTNMNESTISQPPSALPLPVMPSRLQAPKKISYATPLITMRAPPEPPMAPKIGSGLATSAEEISEINEEFRPAELVNFEMLSPLNTPKNQLITRNVSITPKLMDSTKSTLEKIEKDLQELQSFTTWENKVGVEYEPVITLKRQVETLRERNNELEKERLEYLLLGKEFEIISESLSESQSKIENLTKRNAELETERDNYLQSKNEADATSEILTATNARCDELQVELSKVINSNKTANENIAKYEAELAELKKTNERLEMENREAVNLEFEYKSHKNKAKLRENELLELLSHKEKEIKKLEKSLNTISAERLQNAKDELLHMSLNDSGKCDHDGKICIKCEHLQSLLEDNEKNSLEFQKLTLEYEKLKLNYDEIQKDNEAHKLKIIHLEELQEKEKAECEKLLSEVDQLKNKLAEVQRDYEKLGIENASKDEECVALNRQVEEARREMVVLEEKFSKLEISWQEQQRSIKDIETQYSTIQTKYEQLQNQYEQLEVTRDESVADYQRLEKENRDLQTEIEDLKKKVHDAQQSLLESSTKCAEAAKESKEANEEYLSESSKMRQENEQIKKQLLEIQAQSKELQKQNATLLEIQTQFKELQNEYEDLSNQLMDNIQESECIKLENTRLQECLKNYEAKKGEITKAEVEAEAEIKKQKLSELECNNIDINGCENLADYIEKLKQEIEEQKAINKRDRFEHGLLLESTEQSISAMKEQITQLSSELLEKSMFVENCACKTYQQQIETLEREKMDITIICEELQEKFNHTLNSSDLSAAQVGGIKTVADDKLKELEALQLREQELLETCAAQTQTLEQLTQRCNDLTADLEMARNELERKENEFRATFNQMQLDSLQKLEVSANEYRDNMKRYNKEWEERKDEYEQIIKDLRTQIDIVKQAAAAKDEVQIRLEKEDIAEIGLERHNMDAAPDSETCDEQGEIKGKLKTNESQLQQECSREESMQTLQQTGLVERTEGLESAFNNINLDDYKQMQNKLQKAEQQIELLCSEDRSREELIQTLQEKLSAMAKIEGEKEELEAAIEQLEETRRGLQTKEIEVENLKQEVEKLMENMSKLQASENELTLKNSELQEQKTVLEEELECLKEKEMLHSLSCLTEKLETTQNQLKENEKLISLYREERAQAEQELDSLKKSFNKTIEEKHQQLEDTQREREKTKQENANLLHDMQALREDFSNVMQEKQKQEQIMERYQKDSSQLKEELTKLEAENQKQQLSLDTVTQELTKQRQIVETTQKDNSQLKEELKKLGEETLNQQLSLDTLKQQRIKMQEELEQKDQIIEKYHNDNSQLREFLQKLEEEKQKEELSLNTVKQEQSKLQEEVKELKISLSKMEQQKQKESKNFENNHQKVKQLNQQLQNELKDLYTDLASFKEDHQKALKENSRLQTELHETKESLTKLQEEQQNLQGKLIHYEKLQDDKNKLETTLHVFKTIQKSALISVQEEKDQLQKTLEQYEKENKEFKEKEEILQQKVESLCQQVHEMRSKAQSYEKLLLEHEEVERILTSTTSANQKLQEEIAQLASQQEDNVSKIVNLSSEIVKLNKQLGTQSEEKQMLHNKLSHLKENLQAQQSSLQKEHNELKGSMEELKLKCDSLQSSNTQLENLNKQLEGQLDKFKQKLEHYNSREEELKVLKVQHSELQQNLKKSIEEAQSSSKALYTEMLQKQLSLHNSTKLTLETKVNSLSKENLKLSASINDLHKEKLSLEQKLREITVRNFEQDLQRQAIDATANTSADSNTSQSPRGRRSLERLSLDKVSNLTLEEKLSTIQQKSIATAERKNRRLSTHDERRRQSYWGATHDKNTMTDPIDSNCKCMELDSKLKECERNLFIKNSQVTALNMELKYHPMIEENALLKKRIQEEQDKHRNELKRCKAKLREQVAKTEKAGAEAAHYAALSEHVASNAELAAEQQLIPVLPKVLADAETQTNDDLNTHLQKLNGKYKDLQNICRHRYNVIRELEEKMAQKENSNGNSLSVIETNQIKMLKSECESLQNQMKTVMKKYEAAKKVLSLRRVEILKLQSELEKQTK